MKRLIIFIFIILSIMPSYSGILSDGIIEYDKIKEQKIIDKIKKLNELEFQEYLKEVDSKIDTVRASFSDAVNLQETNEPILHLEEWIERDKYIYFPQYKHEDVQRYAYILAKDKHMDYLFFIAVMLQESNMRSEAIHINGEDSPVPGSYDRGVFQINSAYEAGYKAGFEESFDVFNVFDNMIVSFKRLSEYFEKYKNYLMIAGMWNKGEGGILRYHVDDYLDLGYVKSVERKYYTLHKEYVEKYMEEIENGRDK